MMRFSLLLCVAALLIAVAGSKTPATGQSANVATAPVYTADGKLVFPPNYREWIYLTTGLDMDYSPTVNLADHSMFDNVFVNPDAYKAFVATGKWPDKTVFVLEGRLAGTKVPHLSYVGDAEVGADVNLGASTITANYDGVDKHRTRIGDGVHTSIHTSLVAPVDTTVVRIFPSAV